MSVPELDQKVRLRLARRFGSGIDAWFDALPAVLSDLAARWQIAWGPLIQRGSVSVVIRCRTAEGRAGVLKVSPDRQRVSREAAGLASWRTAHVPAVLAVDEAVGALLIEAIEPGTPLVEFQESPSIESLAELMTSLHENGIADPAFPPLVDRITYLFESGRKPYERKPDLVEVIAPEVYERGLRLALRLAADPTRPVLVHGDLTPVNVLDGGAERGLVAIDPAPCLGDPTFDAIDFVLWRAEGVDEIVGRAERLGRAIGSETGRMLDWCAAFAGMSALESAEESGRSHEQLEPLLTLASRV